MLTLRLALLLTVSLAASATPTLTLDNPNLTGAPGDTVGWGFTLTSTPILDGSDVITPWLVITDASFDLDSGVFPVGVFNAFIKQPSNYMAIGPDTGNGEVNPWTQAFDDTLQTGIGSYVINDFQSPGDLATGNIVLTFSEYRFSPNDPAFTVDDTIATNLTVSAPASVLVATQELPEPGSWLLLSIGVALIAIGRRYSDTKVSSTELPRSAGLGAETFLEPVPSRDSYGAVVEISRQLTQVALRNSETAP